MTTFLTDTETVMVLSRSPHAKKPDRPDLPKLAPREIEQAVVRMKLEGAAHPKRMIGLEKLPGVSNYFIGNDSAKWRTDVPHFGGIEYVGVYPGIDLAWYGNQERLEYDFIVALQSDDYGALVRAGRSEIAMQAAVNTNIEHVFNRLGQS
jgi:hypothetical protein